MTAYQLIGPLPPLTLDAGCMVTFEAIDPATGAAVTGVTVSSASLYGVNLTDDADTGPAPEEDPLPLFVPIPGPLEDTFA